MPRYAITEKAGRFVAAHRNTGVGMVLELTEKQAEHELRLGTLVALDTSPEPLDLPPGVLAEPSPESNSQAGRSAPAAIFDPARKGRRGKQ